MNRLKQFLISLIVFLYLSNVFAAAETLNFNNKLENVKSLSAQVLGASLFNHQCKNLNAEHFSNPNYKLGIGDKIAVQIWGRFNFNDVLVIDTQGNIFLPEIGPIRLSGVVNSDLNRIITAAINKTFKKGVQAYSNLMSEQPVQIYVSGFVDTPGLYNGLSSNSVMYYLCQAGGINSRLGSYRDIAIIRDGKQIHQLDLYQFLFSGQLEHFQLHQGDTVVVRKQHHKILLANTSDGNYYFEFKKNSIQLKNILSYIKISDNITHVRIKHTVGTFPTSQYIALSHAVNSNIVSGDELTFLSDKNHKQISVNVKGEVLGPHEYILSQGSTLNDLISKLKLSKEADASNLQLFRYSVAEQQQQAIEDNLSRLQRQVMTSVASTTEGAGIQATQAKEINEFVSKAKAVKVKGQVVLNQSKLLNTIKLEEGDEVILPQKTTLVTVSGEVLSPLSLQLNDNYDLDDYINAAGGFSTMADKNKIMVLHRNGQTEVAQRYWLGRDGVQVKGGDQIIVLAKGYTENWQITETITKILYQIAVSAKVALAI